MSRQKHFEFCAHRSDRATALIETALVLPMYMIVLFGLIYFGYATLGRQRQDKITAYAAWGAGGTQPADQLADPYWATPANPNPFTLLSSSSDSSSAVDNDYDTTFTVTGDSATGQWVRASDEYYGMTINGTVPIPCQLVGSGGSTGGQWVQNTGVSGTNTVFIPNQENFLIHSLYPPSSPEIFDPERVSVDLWNFALGATSQSFNWTPTGIQQQFNTSYTDFANYLNMASPVNTPSRANFETQGGLMRADNSDSPNSSLATPPGWGGLLAGALNGPAGSGQPWLQRRAVESTMIYAPSFLNTHTSFNLFYADQGSAPAGYGDYITSNYAPPANLDSLTTAKMDSDVTIPTGVKRQGAEEGAPNFLTVVGGMIGETGSPPNSSSADAAIVNLGGALSAGSLNWTPSAAW